MFAEMRQFARAHHGVPPEYILQLATLNGARALGLAGRTGELTPGALADLIVLPLTTLLPDCHEAILNHCGPVAASMIDGEWAVAPAT